MNHQTKLFYVSAILLTLAGANSNLLAQGCVASRGAGVCAMPNHGEGEGSVAGSWDATVGYRWLHSDRHFTGDHEDTQREAQGSQVINDSNFIDLGITYNISARYSVGAVVPYSSHDRSSTYVLNGGPRTRYHTQSSGLGDIRLEGHGWVLDPAEKRKWNVQLGLGISAPTGDDAATDLFAVVRGNAPTQVLTTEERTVDQSIQPGTGGWGITLDINSYYLLDDRWTAFVNGAYTITPEAKNGVPTFRGGAGEGIMSIADSYMGRAGFSYTVWPKHGLNLSLAGRIEGVPVWDVIGYSDGFRRPGFAISIEPGISAMVESWSFNLYTPVALYRNRERSVPDLARNAHGDAAFADFVVMASVGKHF